MVVSIRSAYDSSVNYILQKLEAINITPARNTLHCVRDTVSPCLRATYHFAIYGIKSLPLAGKLAISSIPLDMAKQIVARVGFPNEQDVLQHKACGLEAITHIRAALTGRASTSRSQQLINAYQRLKQNVHHYHSDDPTSRNVVLGGVLTTVAALGVLATIKYVYTSGYWDGANNSYERVVYYQDRSASNISSSLLGAAITGIFGFWVGESLDLTGKQTVLQSRFDGLRTDYIQTVRTSCTATEERDQARIERDQIGTALAEATAELTQERTGHNQLRTEHEQLATEYDQFRIESPLRTDRRVPRTEGIRLGIELARTTAERNQARIERDQARESCDQLRRDRFQANTHRDQARIELARTIAERDQIKTERDQARTECDRLRASHHNLTTRVNQFSAALQAHHRLTVQQFQIANQRLAAENTQLRAALLNRQVTYSAGTQPIRLTAQQRENVDDVCKYLDLRCGIIKNTYDKPVIVETGLTYENEEICRHFSTNTIFPTGEPVSGTATFVPNGMIRDIVGLVRLTVLRESAADQRQAVHNVLSSLPDLPFRDPVVLMEDLGSDYPLGMTIERDEAEPLRAVGQRAEPFVSNLALKGYINQLRTYKEQNPDGPPAVRRVRTVAEAAAEFLAARRASAAQDSANAPGGDR